MILALYSPSDPLDSLQFLLVLQRWMPAISQLSRKRHHRKAVWQFTTGAARIKLKHCNPSSTMNRAMSGSMPNWIGTIRGEAD
jgi:hypothetical protein